MAWSSSRSLPSNTERSSCCSAVIGILVSNVLVGRWIESTARDSGVGNRWLEIDSRLLLPPYAVYWLVAS